jgi:NAD(P)-dependent dehydrogenase (short-subunit alcohol dehydrogenase family)
MGARWVGTAEAQSVEGVRRFDGKGAIVTGASSGIGLATARRLVAEGARVVGLARGVSALQRAQDELGAADFHVVSADIRDPDAIEAGVDDAVRWLGGAPHVLVNSAAVFKTKPALETSIELWDETLETNVRGSFLMSCAAVRAAKEHPEQGLSIVNVASTALHRGLLSDPSVAYSVSKTGLTTLTTQTALEWAPVGVRVNLVVPGVIDTPMLKITQDPVESQAFLDSTVPQRRIGTADEVAALICFLASEEAPYITGSSIIIDGGRLLV